MSVREGPPKTPEPDQEGEGPGLTPFSTEWGELMDGEDAKEPEVIKPIRDDSVGSDFGSNHPDFSDRDS